MIAEGIETREQLVNARVLGANLIQGYFYSKPLPIEELMLNPLFKEREDEINIEYYHTISEARLPSIYKPYYHLEAKVPMVYARAVMELRNEKAVETEKGGDSASVGETFAEIRNNSKADLKKNSTYRIKVLRVNVRMQEFLQDQGFVEFQGNNCLMREDTELSIPLRKAIPSISRDKVTVDFNLKISDMVYHCQIAWLADNPEKELTAYILNLTNFELRPVAEQKDGESFDLLYQLK